MLDEAQYASDTDESDEDYKPGEDGSDVSEVESDGEPENDVEKDTKSKRGGNKRAAAEPTPVATKRTRQSEEVVSSSTTEKDELVDDDDDVDEDALWASFLNKAGQATAQSKPKEPTKTTASNGSSSKPAKEKEVEKEKPKVEVPSTSTVQKKIVTEIFEFAGEKVEVQKEVKVTDEKPAASSEASSKKSNTKPGPALPFNRPRSSGGGGSGGLSSVLGQIGKKNKLSILEKTKLDWGGFKQSEGIDEELQTFNKGRDGYLERQDFLQRTDVRQFEIEKNLRAANRKKL